MMAILVDGPTAFLSQGMTGWAGTYHTNRMIQYGTRVVAGARRERAASRVWTCRCSTAWPRRCGRPRANASIVFVPPDRAASAMIEAIEAEMPLVVDGDRTHPRARHGTRARGATWLADPPGRAELARRARARHVPDRRHGHDRARRGSIGVVSRSASLTSEVVKQITTTPWPVGHGRRRRGSRCTASASRMPGAVLRGSRHRGRRAHRRDRRRSNRRPRLPARDRRRRSPSSRSLSAGMRRCAAGWATPARNVRARGDAVAKSPHGGGRRHDRAERASRRRHGARGPGAEGVGAARCCWGENRQVNAV